MNNFPSSQWGTSDMIISLLTIPLSFPRKLYISLNLYKCRYGYLVTYNDMDFKLTVDIAILSVSVRLLDLFEVTIIRVEAMRGHLQRVVQNTTYVLCTLFTMYVLYYYLYIGYRYGLHCTLCRYPIYLLSEYM